MRYVDFLAQFPKNHCPFCHVKKAEILEETKYNIVVPTRAPYSWDHLMIIPKKHYVFLDELSDVEYKDLFTLIRKWTKKLHTKYENIGLLLRDAVAGEKSGKSIHHLHFHLIPDCQIGAFGKNSSNRRCYEDEPYAEVAEELRRKYK